MGSAGGAAAVGAADLARDQTLAAQRRLSRALRLVWTQRAVRGFFLRAEDFFGFTKRLAQERAELQQQLTDTEREDRAADRSDRALGLAQGPLKSSLADMERRYGADLDANSHGQSFLQLFRSRFVPDGLFLLDEPETPPPPANPLSVPVRPEH